MSLYDSEREQFIPEKTNRPPSAPPGSLFTGISAALFIIGVAFLAAGIPLFVIGLNHLNSNIPSHTYDYVIVGGGAAGCVMAERLSRDPHNSVLLIEAGPRLDDDPIVREVTAASNYIETEHYNQLFYSYAQLYNPPRTFQYTTGRLLGGGSSINNMQFVRGTNWIYDQWLSLTGDPIWSTDSVLESFKEVETYHGVDYDTNRRGDDGMLSVWETMTVAPQTTPTSFSEKLVRAYTILTNLTALDDYNNMTNATQLGPFYRWQLSAYPNGTRSSSSIAFLPAEVMARPNLHVSLQSTVTYVRFNDKKHAEYVIYLKDGFENHARANKRIIMSAGVYTPVILQHSGIGNATYLSSIGIPVVYDNPNVGLQYWNHMIGFATFTKNASDVPSLNPADIFEGGAFLPTPNPDTPPYNEQVASPRRIQVSGINTADPVMLLALADVQPRQPGYVLIRDTDPLRIAASDDMFFIGPEGSVDQTTYANAYQKYVCDLATAYQTFDTDYILVDPPPSICGNATLLYAWVGANVADHQHHWTSSCRMGKAGDGISVTNSKGSVWGVTGLSIVDDTLLPIENDGNTQAPAYLVANTLAKEILAGRF